MMKPTIECFLNRRKWSSLPNPEERSNYRGPRIAIVFSKVKSLVADLMKVISAKDTIRVSWTEKEKKEERASIGNC